MRKIFAEHLSCRRPDPNPDASVRRRRNTAPLVTSSGVSPSLSRLRRRRASHHHHADSPGSPLPSAPIKARGALPKREEPSRSVNRQPARSHPFPQLAPHLNSTPRGEARRRGARPTQNPSSADDPESSSPRAARPPARPRLLRRLSRGVGGGTSSRMRAACSWTTTTSRSRAAGPPWTGPKA